MHTNIAIPDKLVKYILFQRTTHIKYASWKPLLLLNKYGLLPLYDKAISCEAFFRKKEIKRLFLKDMNSEYQRIKSSLPEKCGSILDIGCGVAGIDLFLFQHYQQDKALQFNLLDKTEIDKKVYYNFKTKGAFYNSLSAAGDFLQSNGIPQENIELLEVSDDYKIKVSQKLDLVISLISWGFHYPVSTYLDQVYALLREGGYLIMDLRNETDGEELLRQKFSSVTKLCDFPKAIRVVAIK